MCVSEHDRRERRQALHLRSHVCVQKMRLFDLETGGALPAGEAVLLLVDPHGDRISH